MLTKEKIKKIRSLHRKKFREQLGLFLIEGPKMLEEAMLYAPDLVQEVYVMDSALHLCTTSKDKVYVVAEKELRQLSMLKQPQSLVAVCSFKPTSENAHEGKGLILALDRIQDPGNFGTILRLAAWFGVKQVLASDDTVELYNPKVVQASMGSVFTVNVNYVNLEEVLKETKLPIYGALLEGESVYKSTLSVPSVLLMGNEGNGISDELLPLISNPIHIPKFGLGESLNVAMATGIFLSEYKRNDM